MDGQTHVIRSVAIAALSRAGISAAANERTKKLEKAPPVAQPPPDGQSWQCELSDGKITLRC